MEKTKIPKDETPEERDARLAEERRLEEQRRTGVVPPATPQK
jgi:hypothetical protein